MSEPSENRPSAFTPARFGLLLALLVFAAFPQVILGLETFVARDYGFFAYPLAHFQQDCFRHGELPFWNPYNNCGVPFLAQWNTMPLYPPALFYLALPLTWSLGMFSLLHLWWAGFGMFLLARRWTKNDFAAAFAGTAFAFNGFTLNLLMWPSHIATFSWLPWVIMATECAWLKGGRKIFLAGIVGAFQMLAGGPETILLTWLIVIALWLQQFIRAEIPRATLLARFPLVPLLVFALSAAQLLPFLDLVSHAQRETGYTDLRWSMPASGLANFFVPMAFGSTVTEGIFFQTGQAWTSSYYLGLGALWLMFLAVLCIRERRVWLLGGAVAVSILCAFGENTPIYPLLRHLIPQLSFITYPVKYVMVAVFAAPLLAAFALANITKFPKKILSTGAILLALIIGILFWSQHAPQPGNDAPAALHNGITRVLFLLLTGAVLYFLTRLPPAAGSFSPLGKKARMRGLEPPVTSNPIKSIGHPLLCLAPVALILIAWFDVYTHEPRQNPTVPPGVYEQNLARTKLAMNPQPELGGSRAMLSPSAALALTRIAAKDAQNNFLAKRAGLCANVNLLDGIPKVDGFFSLVPHDFDVLLSLMYGDNNGNWSHLEDFLGASQTTAPDKLLDWQPRPNFQPLITAGQRPVFLDDTNTLYAFGQNNFDGASMVFLPPSEKDFVTATNQTAAKILSSKFTNRTVDADVDAPEPSLVVIAQTYYHDWNATIDGQPARLLRANFAFQGVQVSAGKHTIHLFYHDRALQLGAVISGIGWIVSLTALLFWRRRA